MKSLGLICAFLVFSFFAKSQISMDSIITMAINNHRLEFNYHVNKSGGILYYIEDELFEDKTSLSHNNNFEFKIKSVSFFDYQKRKVKKGKIILYIEKVFFEDSLLKFFIVAGILNRRKGENIIRTISENLVIVKFNCDTLKWDYSYFNDE
jgi:hypothetical protein